MLRMRSMLSRISRFDDVGFRVVVQSAPISDFGELPAHIAQNRTEEALELSLQNALHGEHPALRAAGRCYLDLHHLVDSSHRHEHLAVLPGMRELDGHRYYLARLPMSWTGASRLAESAGGHLATITTSVEREWIERNFFPAGAAASCWIGASRKSEDKDWEWVMGERANFEPPHVRTVNGIPRPENAGSALLLAAASDAAPRGGNYPVQWFSDGATERHAFLIEWDKPDGGEGKGVAASRR